MIILFGGRLEPAYAAAGPDAAHAQINFPKPLEDYHDDQMPGLLQKLMNRVRAEPFNLIGTLIFFCAILHTFLTAKPALPEGIFATETYAYRRKGKAQAGSGADYYRAHLVSRLDGLHSSLRCVSGPGISVLPGLRRSDKPSSRRFAFARANAGRVLSGVAGYPRRMSKVVDRSGTKRIDRMAINDRRNHSDSIQRQRSYHLSRVACTGVFSLTEIRGCCWSCDRGRFDSHRECAQSGWSIDPGIVLWQRRNFPWGARVSGDCPDNYNDGGVHVAAVGI